MSAPAVSVVICVFDGERFLREAVASVFGQTYGDFEVLLVDDGSRDGSRALAEAIAGEHPGRVRVLEHPGRENRGISASRNLGLHAARGRYLAFLDADDVWLPEKLARQVAALEAHPDVAMVVGPHLRWYGWTGRASDARRDSAFQTGLPAGVPIEPPSALTLHLRSGGVYVPAVCSLLVRREVALALGGFEADFRDLFEDQVFISKVCLGHRILALDEVGERYRQHPASCCAQATARGAYDPMLPNPARGRFLRWLEQHVAARGARDPELSGALRRELRPYRHPLLSWPYAQLPWLRLRARRALKQLLRRCLPAPLLRWAKARVRGRVYVPPPGWVRFGSLRRLAPLSRTFGFDRGLPVDRHYIERFLAQHAADVRGRTLEIGDDAYTRRFGGERVERADVLHVEPGAPGSTFVGDLATAEQLPSDAFDCFVLTQTLQLVYDLPKALATIHRVLRPGGVVLATLPGLSQLSEDEWAERWCWSFTALSARRLFESVFSPQDVEVATYGNVLAATAFLHGLAAGELRAHELAHADPRYPLLISVRAVKPLGLASVASAPAGRAA